MGWNNILKGISAISPLASEAANGIMNIGANKKNREHQEYMYNKMRADQLADRAFENEYNSPAANMARLKEAGLNPNLVYGNGASEQKSASTSPINAPYGQDKAVQIDPMTIPNTAMSIYDMNAKQAQTDNIKAMTDIAKQEVINKALQAANIAADTENKILTSGQKTQSIDNIAQMQPVLLEQAKANVIKTGTEIDKNIKTTAIALQENERRKLLTANTLRLGIQSIINDRIKNAKTQQETVNLKQSLNNSKLQAQIMEFEVKLNKLGYTKSDPAYVRLATTLASEVIKQAEKIPVGPNGSGINLQNVIDELFK